MHNPYATPDADLNGVAGVKRSRTILLSSASRIGRWRFLAYAWGPTLVIALVLGWGNHAVTGRRYELPGGAFGILLSVSPFFVMARRRLHDMDRSGWLVPLLLVPLLNLVLAFILIFVEGSDGYNRHGPVPEDNPGWMTYAAAPLALLTALGMLAAIIGSAALFVG